MLLRLLFSSPVISSLHYPPLSSLHFSFLPRHLSSCPLFPTLPLSSLLFPSFPYNLFSSLPFRIISPSLLTSNPDGWGRPVILVVPPDWRRTVNLTCAIWSPARSYNTASTERKSEKERLWRSSDEKIILEKDTAMNACNGLFYLSPSLSLPLSPSLSLSFSPSFSLSLSIYFLLCLSISPPVSVCPSLYSYLPIFLFSIQLGDLPGYWRRRLWLTHSFIPIFAAWNKQKIRMRIKK